MATKKKAKKAREAKKVRPWWLEEIAKIAVDILVPRGLGVGGVRTMIYDRYGRFDSLEQTIRSAERHHLVTLLRELECGCWMPAMQDPVEIRNWALARIGSLTKLLLRSAELRKLRAENERLKTAKRKKRKVA